MKQATVTLRITGMTCEHCRETATRALEAVPGVASAAVSLEGGDATVRGDLLDTPRLVAAVEEAGFGAEALPAPSAGQGLEAAGSRDVDLVVIGGGSAGFAAALRADELGARVVMVNAGTIGGTCVNVGCVPSKTLIRAAQAAHRANHHSFAGVEAKARVTDFAAVVSQKDELVSALRGGKYVDVIAGRPGVELVDGRAVLGPGRQVEVDGRRLSAGNVVIATGSSPFVPPIPGLRDSGYLTSTTAFELERLPESLIVLGGRYIALETAQMFARFGSRVTILQRSDRILPTEDEDLTEALRGYLDAEGLRVLTGVSVQEVLRDERGISVRAVVDGVEQTLRAEHILCATGRRPNTSGLGLEAAGVALAANGAVVTDEYLETSLPGVYAAGDVAGDPAFVYTAAYEGNLAASNALSGEQRSPDYTALPWVIFTDPQVAGVGLNEREAAQQGIQVDVARLDLEHVPRALAARDARGFIKLLRRRGSDQLVGARVLAPEGGEQIMEAALAVRHDIGVSALAGAFHPYLTQAEGIKLCAQTFEKDVAKLSCCAA